MEYEINEQYTNNGKIAVQPVKNVQITDDYEVVEQYTNNGKIAVQPVKNVEGGSTPVNEIDPIYTSEKSTLAKNSTEDAENVYLNNGDDTTIIIPKIVKKDYYNFDLTNEQELIIGTEQELGTVTIEKGGNYTACANMYFITTRAFATNVTFSVYVNDVLFDINEFALNFRSGTIFFNVGNILEINAGDVIKLTATAEASRPVITTITKITGNVREI